MLALLLQAQYSTAGVTPPRLCDILSAVGLVTRARELAKRQDAERDRRTKQTLNKLFGVPDNG